MKRLFVVLFVVLTLVCMGTLFASAQETEKQEGTAQATETKEVKKIDVNSATRETLETLPDIGQKLAQAIIDNRPYATIEEVKTKVSGIGEKKFEAIKDLIEAKPVEKTEEQTQDESKKE